MKTFLFKSILYSALATFTLTACNNDETEWQPNSPTQEETEAGVPAGHFRATFFPQQAQTGGNSRAVVQGSSEQIQSLVCLIYQKQADGTYLYNTEQSVITYTGTAGENITPQTYQWPLQQSVSFTLPKGDYKAVFVGNVDKNLFAEQNDNAILTDYQGDMANARINMPEKGPLGFNQYNMYYLCVVDFSQANPSPNVLMQRIMANNVYGRNMVDTNNAIPMLVNNLVKEIRQNDLTTDVVKALLHSSLLNALSKATGLDAIAGGLTHVVDRLVNLLLGDVVEKLNEVLLKEVTNRLTAALKGEANPETNLAGLNYILNPWTTAKAVNVTYKSFPKSIDFNRNCRSYYPETNWENIPITHNNNLGTFSVIGLCGQAQLKEINVSQTESYTELLAPILNKVDQTALNGLLVNIHVPLQYTQQSNLQYKTTYELVNLTLSDFKDYPNGEPLKLRLNIKDVVNVEELVKKLLGDNILTNIVGGLTDKLLQPLVDALNTVVIEKLDIHLPGLNLSNIVVNGSWDATHVSDGTITPNVTQ